MLHKEYELGYDQFHQGESYIAFYFLCLADPTNPINIERAKRFAGFYLNEDPDAPNYDPEHKLIRAAHNGSGGPRWGYSDHPQPSYNWGPGMRVYGLPFNDLPGIDHYDDLEDPAKARRMGQAMNERMGRGDVAGNLIVTSLVANAYLLTGEEKYRAIGLSSMWTPGWSVQGKMAVCCPTMSVSPARSASIWTASGTAASTAGRGRMATTTSAWQRLWPGPTLSWSPVTSAISTCRAASMISSGPWARCATPSKPR